MTHKTVTHNTATHNVVIIGGGYAGTTAANRLAASAPGRRGDLAVAIVNPRARFVERIRLHEYAASTRQDATVSYEPLLNARVRLTTAAVTGIDPAARTVALDTGGVLGYDHLVYAAGSGAASVPRGTHAIDNAEGVAGFRTALDEARAALGRGATTHDRTHHHVRVAVVGGGLTAVETASELAEQNPELRVALHASRLIASLNERARDHVRVTLGRLGVVVHEGVAVHADAGIDMRTVLESDLVVWCAGFGVPQLAASSGLPVDPHGRLLVTPTLHSAADERILGAGDAVRINDSRYDYLRMACATAMPQGGRAADNILREIAGRPPIAHSNGFLAQCVSLGRRDAVIQFVHLDDRSGRMIWTGRLGVWAKETISRWTIDWARGEGQRSGSYVWVPRRLPATASTRRKPATA